MFKNCVFTCTILWFIVCLGSTLAEQHGSMIYFDTLTRPARIHAEWKKLSSSISDEDLAVIRRELVDVLVDPVKTAARVQSQQYARTGVQPASLLRSVTKSVEQNLTACANDTGRMLLSILENESWILKFLDAAGKPGPSLSKFQWNFVGDYYLCLDAKAPPMSDRPNTGFGGKYCRADVQMGPDMNAPEQASPFFLGFRCGLCFPKSCTSSDVTDFLNATLGPALNALDERLNMSTPLSLVPAECKTDDRDMEASTIVAIVFLSIIAVLVVIGTSIDLIFVQWPKWSFSKQDLSDLLTNVTHDVLGSREENNDPTIRYGSTTGNEAAPLLPNKDHEWNQTRNLTAFTRVMLAFSVYTNGSKVLNTSQPPGSLTCVHGIRFLSITWVILGHTYTFGIDAFENPTVMIETLLKRWTFDAIANAFVSVDTFFTLSGVLVSYVTMKMLLQKGWKINWAMFYFHRFWRLTPPYMLVLITYLGLTQYMGRGPLWPSVMPQDKTMCEDNWWTNLLYINNLAKNKEMCMAHSWYLANDMQFYIVSPLILIPLCLNIYLGLAVCLVMLMAHWITTGVLSTVNDWPASLVSNAGVTADFFLDYYVAPWCRIGPYIVGMMTGYLLCITGCRLRIPWIINLAGWAVATAVGLAVVYGIRGDIDGTNVSSVGVAAFYNCMARSAWAACVCWVIVSCVTGHGGFVNSILSWGPLVPLSRMTYIAYLVHPAIMLVYIYNRDTLFYSSDLNMIYLFFGHLVSTYLVSFVLMLAFESPWIGVERVLLRRKKD